MCISFLSLSIPPCECVYLHTFVHLHISTWVCPFAHLCAYVRASPATSPSETCITYEYTHTHTHTHIFIYIYPFSFCPYLYVSVSICMCMCFSLYVCVYLHMCVLYKSMSICICVCIFRHKPLRAMHNTNVNCFEKQ